MHNQRQPDVEAEVTFLSAESGGKLNAVKSGYHPMHQVLEDYITSGHHEYLDKNEVWPGETAVTQIWFITPEAYPGSLWIGRKVRVQEGSRLVGDAKITKIFNKLLERPA
jgi:translation elongation factor EF-Tu-like GTPase